MLSAMKFARYAVAILPVLASTLACQAATRLIFPDTATPLAYNPPPVSTTVVAPPSPTSTRASTPEASCPSELSSILKASKDVPSSLRKFPVVDTRNQIDIPLVDYTVSGNHVTDPIFYKVPPDLSPYQNDLAMQKGAWELFATLIPADQRTQLSEFHIITDGPGGVQGAVAQADSSPVLWVLEVDIADVPDTKDFVFTLLHEFGHLLTLQPSQVPPDIQIFNNPQDNYVYDRERNTCSTYFPGEGCSLGTSYINAFYDNFWLDIADEWSKIDSIQNDQKRLTRLQSFYYKYRDQFVDDYAVTSPSEDIAETWAYYVLNPKPTGNSLFEQKIEFFYNYPELVTLRNRILQNLCLANP